MHSVLLIDDEPGILDVFQHMAKRSGELAIQTASSAKEGLEFLGEKPVDAIIVDYSLPEINGIEFLKILRGRHDTTPVIIFTGAGREHTAIEALNNGANFYLKKADDPAHVQYRQLVAMVNSAVEGFYQGKPVGTARRIIEDMVNFSPDPGFAIDSMGTVIAWNESLEHFTDTPAAEVMGKKNLIYAKPLLGERRKTILDLVFASDEEIRREKIMLIKRVQRGPVIAVTRGKKKDGKEWTLWIKAMPLYDGLSNFIAVAGIVRDVTDTFSDVVISEPGEDLQSAIMTWDSEPETPAASGGLMDKILGKAGGYYKEGALLMTRDRKYAEALEVFDKAIRIDDKLAYVWNDRAVCYRETGDTTAALKSSLRAVELEPGNAECLFTLGETLEKIGVMQMNNKYFESAIDVFKMVVNQMPSNKDAWNHLGVCHKHMGKHEEAKFYLERARDIQLWKKETPTPCKRNSYS